MSPNRPDGNPQLQYIPGIAGYWWWLVRGAAYRYVQYAVVFRHSYRYSPLPRSLVWVDELRQSLWNKRDLSRMHLSKKSSRIHQLLTRREISAFPPRGLEIFLERYLMAPFIQTLRVEKYWCSIRLVEALGQWWFLVKTTDFRRGSWSRIVWIERVYAWGYYIQKSEKITKKDVFSLFFSWKSLANHHEYGIFLVFVDHFTKVFIPK